MNNTERILRLIYEADDIVSALYRQGANKDYKCKSLREKLKEIAAEITAESEVEPVLHARWVNNTYCSNCNRFPVDVSVSISNQELTKYFSRCPHCGARMDGGFENGRSV